MIFMFFSALIYTFIEKEYLKTKNEVLYHDFIEKFIISDEQFWLKFQRILVLLFSNCLLRDEIFCYLILLDSK